MTFGRDVLSYAIECKYLSEALDTFQSPLILQKMKEDNISRLGDYNAPFCEQQYTRVFLYLFVQIHII